MHSLVGTVALGLACVVSAIPAQALDVGAAPVGKMRKVCEHPAQIAKEAPQHAVTLALRPIGKDQTQVKQPHPP